MTSKKRLNLNRRSYMKLASGAAVTPTLQGSVSANSQTNTKQATSQTEKFERLDTYLDENNVEAIWFADSDSYAWLTGHSNVIDRSSPTGVAAVGYDGNEVTIVVDVLVYPQNDFATLS